MKRHCYYIICIILCSCHSESGERTNLKGYILAEHVKTDTLYFSHFIDSVKTVKLQALPEALIGEVIRITRIDNERILVFGKAATDRKLYLFYDDGRFIRTIGKSGRGPGEYITITSYVFDKMNNMIHVYDQTHMAIYKYSLEGTFLGKFKVGLIFEDFTISPGGNYILYCPIEMKNRINDSIIPRGIYLANMEGEFQSVIHRLNGTDNYQFFNQFFFTRSEINSALLSSFDDNVYTFNEEALELEYSIDFGDLSLPQDERASTEMDNLTSEYLCVKGMPAETNRYIFFLSASSISNMVRYCLLDKVNNSCKLYDAMTNDVNKSFSFFIGGSGNEFFAATDDISDISGMSLENTTVQIFYTKR